MYFGKRYQVASVWKENGRYFERIEGAFDDFDDAQRFETDIEFRLIDDIGFVTARIEDMGSEDDWIDEDERETIMEEE